MFQMAISYLSGCSSPQLVSQTCVERLGATALSDGIAEHDVPPCPALRLFLPGLAAFGQLWATEGPPATSCSSQAVVVRAARTIRSVAL
jgi:hypothetical protein